MAISLSGSPYNFEDTDHWILDKSYQFHIRADLLREQGQLSDTTLYEYFKQKRFEHIAESNAISGSTLSAGETQIAVIRGITITGHDPAYSEDAINLSLALGRMLEMASERSPTTLDQVRSLHALILGDAPGAGLFQDRPAGIARLPYRRLSSWTGIKSSMEDWERWSIGNMDASALLRAVVLHTWLTHVHPFIDGNGRVSRVVMNLELIRAGLPGVIIRRKDRLKYYEALAESDASGALGTIAELVLSRADDALHDIESTAILQDDRDLAQVQLRATQERKVGIWNDAVWLLFSLLEDALKTAVGSAGEVATYWYDEELLVDDYAALEQGDTAGNSWLCRINIEVPAVGSKRLLAWTGYRTYGIRDWMSIGPGPSIFWSIPDPTGHRKWIRDDSKSPGVAELTLRLPEAASWIVRLPDDGITRLKPGQVVHEITKEVIDSITYS